MGKEELMQIGAISGAGYMPYIYNTNTVNKASLNKVSAISDDLLASKTDFSALTNGETTNPIKRGQSLDFAGIIDMQMQMSRMNASRVMKEPEKAEEVTQAAGVADDSISQLANAETVADVASVANESTEAVQEAAKEQQMSSTFDYARAMEAYQPIDMYA